MWRSTLFATVLILLTVGMSQIRDFGVSWDEPLHISLPHYNKRFLATGSLPPGDLSHYGTFFDALAELVYKVVVTVSPRNPPEKQSNDERLLIGANEFAPASVMELRRYHWKHRLTFIFGLLGMAITGLLAARLVGNNFAACAVVILALTPRFSGELFFNPKDIPFATLFTLVTWVGARAIANGQALPSNGWKRTFTLAPSIILVGVAVGVSAATRLPAVLLLPLVFCCYLAFATLRVYASTEQLSASSTRRGQPRGCDLLTDVGLWLFSGAITVLIIIALHPVAWQTPVTWLAETLQFFARHDLYTRLLFMGGQHSTQSLPWYYLPVWFAISLPEWLQLLFVLGLIQALKNFRSFPAEKQSLTILLLLQVMLFPLLAIVRGSTLDAGIRQFLFVLPGIAVFACLGAQSIFLIRQSAWQRCLLVLVGCGMLRTFYDMQQLHPYQYIYFNDLARLRWGSTEKRQGLATIFETDYWGLSLKQAALWANDQAIGNQTIYVAGPLQSFAVFASPEIKVLPFPIYVPQTYPFYYVSFPRGGVDGDWSKAFDHCPVVFRAAITQTQSRIPLAFVRHCERAP